MINEAVKVKNLVKSFRLNETSIEILKNINLTVNKGDFLSIMGPSGSGKSTLLYLMGGLDEPTSGSICMNGKELSGMKDREKSILHRRDMGFIFQFYNLIPNLTVEENILLPVLLDGKKRRMYDEKLNDILKLTKLSDRRKHTPRQLSGGQQQRVAIARALIYEPEILLADEPTGNLDSKTGTEILELLRSVNKDKGKTIIMVTHSQEAASYGNRSICLKDGEIEAFGKL